MKQLVLSLMTMGLLIALGIWISGQQITKIQKPHIDQSPSRKSPRKRIVPSTHRQSIIIPDTHSNMRSRIRSIAKVRQYRRPNRTELPCGQCSNNPNPGSKPLTVTRLREKSQPGNRPISEVKRPVLSINGAVIAPPPLPPIVNATVKVEVK